MRSSLTIGAMWVQVRHRQLMSKLILLQAVRILSKESSEDHGRSHRSDNLKKARYFEPGEVLTSATPFMVTGLRGAAKGLWSYRSAGSQN